MKTPKRYNIETLEQLINITTPENFERISIDFLQWLHYTSKAFENIKKKNKKLKDLPNSEIAKIVFIWIDDGKNEFKGVQIKDNSTGEITEVEFKK